MSSADDDKKLQVVFVALAAVAVLGLYWFLVIRTQNNWVLENRKRVEEMEKSIRNARAMARNWTQYQEEEEVSRLRLEALESSMAGADVYRWVVRTFVSQPDRKIEIIEVEPPRHVDSPVGEPYQASTFFLSGKASYHDFGRFLAGLENQFLHMRVQKLELEPAYPDSLDAPDARKLLFRLQLITLARPSGVHNK